jgi:hypothetical protein
MWYEYMTQTGRPVSIQFKEHARTFKYINNELKFAKHLRDNGKRMGNR